jgi:hypothetical protein
VPTPPKTGQDGVWSLRQAQDSFQFPERLLRQVSKRGLLSPAGLTGADVLAVKVIAAVWALPSVNDDVSVERDRDAVRAARDAWVDGDEDAILLVTPGEARYVVDPARVATMLALYREQPRLVLPIGLWAVEVRDQVTVLSPARVPA